MQLPVVPSLLRKAEHAFLSHVTLEGSILDLGGDARSEYGTLVGGDHRITVLNLDPVSRPDIVHDLELPLPMEDGTYDHVLAINVLEHVYAREQLISETARVVRSGGSIVIIMPFLFPVHPSPNDYWRMTKEALRKEVEVAGFVGAEISSLGGGVFTALYVCIDRLMPWPIRLISYYTVRFVIEFFDAAFSRIARWTGRKYDPADYALGYALIAKRA